MSIHALIIDDDTFSLEVLGYMLNAEGVSHTAVKDPLRLEPTLANIGQVDVVFLDLEMPGMNGYAAFELLQRHLGADVPIIACTVHLNEIDNVRDLGFHGFLGKPLDIKRFANQFKDIIHGKAVWEI